MTSSAALQDLYSGAWERRVGKRDAWDRTPLSAWDGPDTLVPHISKLLFERGFRPSYPNGAKFAVCLSHDVDLLRTTRRELFGTMRRGKRAMDRKNLRALLTGGVDPVHSLGPLLEIESHMDVTSTFYFLALEPGDEDFNFDLSYAAGEIGAVLRAGCEVGLHGGHKAYASAAVLSEELRRLKTALGGKTVAGYRGHYLRFRVPDTWHLLEQAGFAYDTTLGWSESIGFRSGLCYPYRPFDPANGKRIAIAELPLAVMERSLFEYMRLSHEQALSTFWRLVDEVENCQGVLTLLWHNGFPLVPYSTYGELVEKLKNRGAWFATGNQLLQHWRSAGYFGQMESLLDELLAERS